MIAILLVLCGSSVYVQKNLSFSPSTWGSGFSALTMKLLLAGFRGGMVAVVTDDRISTNTRAIGELWCREDNLAVGGQQRS